MGGDIILKRENIIHPISEKENNPKIKLEVNVSWKFNELLFKVNTKVRKEYTSLSKVWKRLGGQDGGANLKYSSQKYSNEILHT